MVLCCTWIARKAPGRTTAAQTLAANVDVAFLVAALGAEADQRRIERFATILGEGGVRMVRALGKVDLVDDVTLHLARASHAAPGAPVHAVSALTGAGIEALEPYQRPAPRWPSSASRARGSRRS